MRPIKEPNRIINFKSQLIEKLPFFPNNQTVKNELESQSLGTLLCNYFNWAIRTPPPRPRAIAINHDVILDPRWNAFSGDINYLLNKVCKGEDLAPHLSSKIKNRGYTPIDRINNGQAGRWDDKDFILNTTGFYHFHLGQKIGANGLVSRSNDVLFASVTRTEFNLVGIFNHSVFSDLNYDKKVSQERSKMWQLHQRLSQKNFEPGAVYVSSLIATSGHNVSLIYRAMEYAKAINNTDPNIDSKDWVDNLHKKHHLQLPKKPKFEWELFKMDLCLKENETQNRFLYNQWQC